MQRKQLISVLILSCFILGLWPNLPTNANAYETQSDIALDFTQSTTSQEFLGTMGTVGSFSYYDLPTIDSSAMTHDLTRVNITNLQAYNLTTYPTIYNASVSESLAFNQTITELTCSAPFDTSNIITLTSNNSAYNVSASSIYSAGGNITSPTNLTLLDGYPTSLKCDYNWQYPSSLSIAYYTGTLADLNNIDGNMLTATAWSPTETHGAINFPALDYSLGTLVGVRVKYTTSGASSAGVRIEDAISGDPLSSYVTSLNYDGWIIFTAFAEPWMVTFYASSPTPTNPSMAFDVCTVGYVDLVSDFEVAFPSYALVNSTALLNLRYKTENCTSVQVIDSVQTQTLSNVTSYTNTSLFVSQPGNVTFRLSGAFQTMWIDCLNLSLALNPISNFNLTNFTYLCNGVEYIQNVTLSKVAGVGNLTNAQLNYTFDSNSLSNYDHLHDLVIPAQQLNYTLNLTSFTWNLAESISFTSNRWTVPSEFALSVNGEEFVDSTYNSGYIALSEYPTSLVFDAANPFLSFNFTILSEFSCQETLTVISASYFRSSYYIEADHAVVLSQYEHLFDANTKKTYINNADYGTSKIYSPGVTISADSYMKVEVLLNDQYYMELDPANVSSYSNSETYANLVDDSSITLATPIYPSAVTLAIGQIEGYQTSSYLSTNSSLFTASNASVTAVETLNTGHFRGIYKYGNETDGTRPARWLDLGGWPIESIGVKSSQGSHSKVLDMSNTAGEGLTWFAMNQSSSNSSLELWVNIAPSSTFVIGMMKAGSSWGPDIVFGITIDSSQNLCAFDSLDRGATGATWEGNTWFRLTFMWDQATRDYWLFKNGICIYWGDTTAYSDNIARFMVYHRYVGHAYLDSLSPLQETATYTYGDLATEESLGFLANKSVAVHTTIPRDNLQSINLTYSVNASRNVVANSSVFNCYNASNGLFDSRAVLGNNPTVNLTESLYEAMYINSTLSLNFTVVGFNASAFDLNISQIVLNITYLISTSPSTLCNLTLAEAGIAIDGVALSTTTWTTTLSASRDIVFTTTAACWFDITINYTYITPSNSIQVTTNVTTDDGSVGFKYFYNTSRAYSRWFFSNAYAVSSASLWYNSIAIPSVMQLPNVYFDQFLPTGSLVLADLEIDPEFSVSSRAIVNNGTYCQLEVTVTSDLYIQNVTVYVDDFLNYYTDWGNATQNSASKRIMIDLPLVNTTTTFYLEGSRATPSADLTAYRNPSFWLTEGPSNDITFQALLGFSTYSESWYVPSDSAWTLDGVHYDNTTYALQSNTTFYCDGFDASITSAYLQFTADPINAYTVTQGVDTVTLNLSTNLPLTEVYLVFAVGNLTNYRVLNDSVSELYTLNDVDYYYVAVSSITPGDHTISIEFQTYNMSTVWWILIPIAVVGVIYVYRYYTKKGTKKLQMPKSFQRIIDFFKPKAKKTERGAK